MGRSDRRHGNKKSDKNKSEELFFVKQPIKVLQSTKRALRILDANYVATSTDELVEKQIHLKPTKKEQLKDLLKNYKKIFDGKLGTMTNRFQSRSADGEYF